MSHPDYKYIGTPMTRTIEECSEVIKILCKIDRFGWFGCHPEDPHKIPNIAKLANEIDDLQDMVKELLVYMGRILRAGQEEGAAIDKGLDIVSLAERLLKGDSDE